MAGKYLNGKEVSHCPEPGGALAKPPAGWDNFFVMCPDTCYTDCLFGDNGVARWFNDTSYENGTNYAPAIVGNVSRAFIRQALSVPAATRKPFFSYVAVHSPHQPATPAPWVCSLSFSLSVSLPRSLSLSLPPSFSLSLTHGL